MLKSKKFNWIVIIISIFFLGVCLVLYLLFSTNGSALLTRLIISKYTESNDVSIKEIKGNLIHGLNLKDIQINDLLGLPEGSTLKIQHLKVSVRPLKFDTLNLYIENARLFLPYSDPIVLFADYKKVQLDVNIYSRKVDAEEILNLFVKDKDLGDVSGAITNIDSYVKGSFTRPQLMGAFEIENISYKELTLNNCPGSFAINLKPRTKQRSVQGAIVFGGGVLSTRGINITIEESKIIFSLDSNQPFFDFKGTANISNTKINIAFKGTVLEPQLRLVSQPAYPASTLIFMLVTRRHSQDAQALDLTGVTIDSILAKDLLAYFLYAEDESQVLKHLGLAKPKSSQQLILEIEDEIEQGNPDNRPPE